MEADQELGLGLRAYRHLNLVRASEATIRKHYYEDKMKTPVHFSIRQEAFAVGVCEAFDPGNGIFATDRSHAAYQTRTGDTDGFFGELYGRVLGAARGKAGSMHLDAPHVGLVATSAVVATTIPLALSAPFGDRNRGEDGRAIVFFGDGAVDEGDFWRNLNFACGEKPPVVFVCKDNGLADEYGGQLALSVRRRALHPSRHPGDRRARGGSRRSTASCCTPQLASFLA